MKHIITTEQIDSVLNSLSEMPFKFAAPIAQFMIFLKSQPEHEAQEVKNAKVVKTKS